MRLPSFEHPHPQFGPRVGTTLEALKGLLEALDAQRVFLVTGKRAYDESSLAARMEAVLLGRERYRHFDFSVNPQFDDLMRGAAAFRAFQPDVLIAIGGGSVMDTAKLLPLLPDDVEGATAVLKGEQTDLHRSCPFIAVPTTAGSGSEATQFSVVYIGTQKYSVDHPVLLPDRVVLDPSLTYPLPAYLTATTGMDALSQAIESHWAKGATPESRDYAACAIKTLLGAFPEVVKNPTVEARKRMQEGAYLSGKAINISRTTAPHAASYRIAQLYTIPHGHAVAITLPAFFAYNLETPTGRTDQTPPSGTEAEALCQLLGCGTVMEGKTLLEHLMDEAGLKRGFTQLGATNPADIDTLVAAVNLQRLANNPRPIDGTTLHNLLQTLW